MTKPDAMGLTPDAAKGYEAFFVPAIFHQWPQQLLGAGEVAPGMAVLDVGCGTGVLSRQAVAAVGPTGRVVGVDLSASMLSVARQHGPGVEFVEANAGELPFPDDSFDVVCSAFMLMFVESPSTVLKEMARVAKPGGAIVVSVWLGLERNPIYRDLVAVIETVLGARAADTVALPFRLGASSELAGAFGKAGLEDVQIQDRDGNARFPSVEELVRIEIEAWLLAGQVDSDAVSEIVTRLVERSPSLRAQGEVVFPFHARIGLWRST